VKSESITVAARRVNTRANTKAIEPLKGSPVPFSSAAMSDDPTSTKARDKTRKRPDVIEMMEDSDDDEVRVLAVVSLPMQTTATVFLTHTLSFLEHGFGRQNFTVSLFYSQSKSDFELRAPSYDGRTVHKHSALWLAPVCTVD
jgi:hypothetical protein